MNSIFKEYGGAILAAIGAVGIIALLLTGSFGGFNGINEVFGDKMAIDTVEVSNEETLAVQAAVAGEIPLIRLVKGDLYSDRYYRIGDLFEAYDSDGEMCDIEIYRVTDEEGNSLVSGRAEVDGATDSILFNENGTFRIYVRCRDNKYSGQQFRVMVLGD